MVSAVEIIGKAVAKTNSRLQETLEKDSKLLTYLHGSSQYIENEIVIRSKSRDIYPVIALFTDGVTETSYNNVIEVSVPKIVIAIPTDKVNSSNEYKYKSSFKERLYVIYEEFEKQLKQLHFGYDFKVSKTDIVSYSNGTSGTSLNEICDGIIIKNLNIKVIENYC